VTGQELRNPRHEHFARLVAAGETAAKAYTCVGYSDSNPAACASRLAKNSKVAARIEQLKRASSSQAIERTALSKEWVISKLQYIVSCALDDENRIDSPVRALELLGKELGMFTDRHEFSGALAIDPGRAALPDDRLDAMIIAAQMIAAPAGEMQAEQPTETVQ